MQNLEILKLNVWAFLKVGMGNRNKLIYEKTVDNMSVSTVYCGMAINFIEIESTRN